MPSEHDLAQQLVNAQRSGRHDVDPVPFAALDQAAAYRIQTKAMELLGETPGVLKTAVTQAGAAVAPIFRSRVGESGKLRLPAANVTGLEVEVAVVLARDIDSATALRDEAAIVSAIDHCVVGIEICGTRFTDRTTAGGFGGLADSMSALGYCIDPMHREAGAAIDGLDVILEFNGRQIYAAPAKHGFGSVLASFLAYAKAQHPAYPLKAGTIVTTGSMCGLVPISGTGRAVARFGSHVVEVDIV